MSDGDRVVFKTEKSKNKSRRKKKSKREKFEDDDDFASMIRDLFRGINFKMALFLFISGFLIFNDLFVNNVLNYFNNAVYEQAPTSKGVIIQLLLLCLVFIILDRLIDGDIL